MSDTLYQNLAASECGYLVAPAGCGKTEAIVQCIKSYCIGKQLVLTHTHAGVSALKKRLRKNEVPTEKYHIETISGWALKWVNHYPQLAEFKGTLPIPEKNEWSAVYIAANRLLGIGFVQDVVKFSYSGVLVDEYQDCTIPMHNLIITLKGILPCRILGDPLQAIFSINKNDPLVQWDTVINSFSPTIGEMVIPYRWINANNKALGDWLISVRPQFEKGVIPNFKGTLITIEKHPVTSRTSKLQSLAGKLTGSVCIIGPKHGNHNPKLISALVNIGFNVVEPNDLPDLSKFLITLFGQTESIKKATLASDFIIRSFSGIASNKKFVEDILKGAIKRRPSDLTKRKLHELYPDGYTHRLLVDLIDFLFSLKLKCKRTDSIRTLKKILEKIGEENKNITGLFSEEIMLRKIIGRDRPKRCIGSTLLLKGLEFDHCIILFNGTDKGWLDLKDLYVALTRGCQSIHLFEY